MADQSAPSPAPQEAPTTNVVSPEGDLVSVPNEQLQAALHPVNGYRLATPEDESSYVKEQKYGGALNAVKAAGNEALSTSTFGLVPGIGSAEDIKGLQEQHPVASVVGGALPFAAEQLIPGVGEAADLNLAQKAVKAVPGATEALSAISTVPRYIGKAGEAAKEASGLTGVGAKALQYATEAAIMQGSNEVSKALLKDPDASVAHAITNEGAAALFGAALGSTAGGIGKAAALWADKFGAKSTDAVIDKSLPDIAVQELKSGVDIPEVLKSALGGDQDSYNKVQVLMKSDAHFAKKLQGAVESLYGQSSDKVFEALGVEPSLAETAPNAYEAGTKVKDALKSVIEEGKQDYGPVYDELKKQYKKIPVNGDQRAALAGKLSQAWSEAGFGALEGSAESAQMSKVLKSIDGVDTAEVVKNLNSAVNNVGKNFELTRFSAVTSPILKDFENSVIDNHLTNVAKGSTRYDVDALNRNLSQALKSGDPGAAIEASARLQEGLSGVKGHLESDADKAADLLQRRQSANAAYKEAMNTMNGLNDSLHLGRFKGTNGFLRNLDEMAPEQVLQRLSTKNRQELTQLLQEKFPEAAQAIKQHLLNDMMYKSQMKGGGFSVNKFVNTLMDGSKNPEHIQQLLAGDPATMERLGAIRQILNAIPLDGNPSNSASMLNKLWSGKIGTLVGGALGLGGHGHIAGGALGAVADKVANEINPFLSYKILEMRGAGKNIVPQQVKALLDYSHAVAKGHNIVNKAVDGVFNESRAGTSIVKMPSESELSRFDKYLDQIRKNPEALQNVGSDLKDVMPDHMPALAMSAKSTADYMNGIKPRTAQGLIQDLKVPPSKSQLADYHRQLTIAQQPAAILQHLKDGTLIPQDITTLKTCNPGAYNLFQQKILQKLTDPSLKVPYSSRMSMALFLGQPLDSTMQAMSIVAAQPSPAPQQQAPAQNGSKGSTKALQKAPNEYMTPSQSREHDRAYKRD